MFFAFLDNRFLKGYSIHSLCKLCCKSTEIAEKGDDQNWKR